MVSFWPWRGDNSSTASFEKTLSSLSTKITDTQTRLDRVRSSSRRVRVLCTLYLSFAYVVYAVVLLLVIGYKNLGAYEWTGMAGGPVLIYVTRTLLASLYNFRIDSLSERLKQQQTERAKTIQKLKDATKYDSTMELIEKYSGKTAEGSKGKKDKAGSQQGGEEEDSKQADGQRPMPNRTTMPPPATANIPRRQSNAPNSPMTPQNPLEPSAEFAPNAEFTGPGIPSTLPAVQYPNFPLPQPSSEPRWYDRLFDVLLGEDETAPRNRIALICRSCRLVNGQAPPGTRSLAELGQWRCMACGVVNGEDAVPEGERIMREVLGDKKRDAPTGEGAADVGEGDENDLDEEEEVESERMIGGDSPAATVKRRRGKAKK